jgi:hypothetical protein
MILVLKYTLASPDGQQIRGSISNPTRLLLGIVDRWTAVTYFSVTIVQHIQQRKYRLARSRQPRRSLALNVPRVRTKGWEAMGRMRISFIGLATVSDLVASAPAELLPKSGQSQASLHGHKR